MRGTKTLKVATSYRCFWFWSCTTYRTITAYRVTYRQVTKYYTTSVCCEGYVWHPEKSECLRISGPEETLYTTTEHPSLNQSLSSGSSLPNNSSSSNRTLPVVLPRTTKLSASSNPPITTTTPSNGKDQAMVAPSRARRQATIMISILLFFIAVIVVSIVLGCVVYRRRRARRIQRKSHDLHMEPLRDLQLLSETSSHILHFSPPSAPDDEYAIVDKKTKVPPPAKDPQPSYENTCIVERPPDDMGKDKAQGKTNRLTHTYMERSVCLETNEKMIIPVSMATVPDNCYNEVDEMPSSSVSPDGGVQEYDYCYTKFDNSSPNPNECYAEVDDMPPSSVSREGARQEEYEAIGDVQGTYDHLDRGSSTGTSDREISSKEGCDSSGGKYGVLVQSSSVDSPENYDSFQRSVSETDQSGIDGYAPLIAVPSSGSNAAELVDADAYDDLDRAMPKTQKKGKDLLEKLRQSTNTAYGHLGSSFESDTSETGLEKILEGNPDMEPIYSNQDVALVGDNTSTYTDMSGSRPNSVLDRSISLHNENAPVETYTEMSPTHFSNNYCNVDLENIDEDH